MVKVTFTLDDATVEKIRATAERLKRPQSQIVREAVAEYAAREQRLSEVERQRMLAAIEEFRRTAPARGRSAVRREMAQVRRVRQSGGRRTRVE